MVGSRGYNAATMSMPADPTPHLILAARAWRALRRALLGGAGTSPLEARTIALRALKGRRASERSLAGRGFVGVSRLPLEPWRRGGARLAANDAVAQAMAMIERGDRPEAAMALKLLMHAHPERAQLPYLLAQLALEAGQEGAARRFALLASLRERERPEPHALAGHLLGHAGDLPLARALLKRARVFSPNDAVAQAWLADVEARGPRPDTPVVSVIVPVFNGAETLARTLAAILAQTLEAIEVIVVDDGSTDDSAAVVRRVADPRVSWHPFPNGGPSLCRNRGAALARAPYLSWCDADDVWHPEKLAAQLVALHLEPTAAVVYSGVRFIDMDDQALMAAPLPPAAGDDMRWALIKGCLPICGSNVLMRREVFEHVGGFDPALRLAEDWDLWLRLAQGHRWARVMAHHVDYRSNPRSASTNVLAMAEASRAVLARAHDRLPGAPADVRTQAIVNLYSYLANRSLSTPWHPEVARAAWGYFRHARAHLGPGIRPMVGAIEAWRLARRRLRGLGAAATLSGGRRLAVCASAAPKGPPKGPAGPEALRVPAPARDPRWTTTALITEALQRQAWRRPASATQLLLRARAIDPAHSQVHYLLGDLAIHAGRLEEALAHVTRSLGWSRAQPDPFALAGYLLHLLGDSALGRRLLERALSLDPAHARARACLADLLARPRATRRHPHLEVLARPQTIGGCMIVKNEARQLRRHLPAALPHLDECVVLDTGSSDDTVAVAEAFGAKVGHFPWCDDFAAARNAALALGTTDWVLTFDADEEVVVRPGHLRALIEKLPLPSLTGVAPIVHVAYINHLGSPLVEDGWQVESVPRLFRRESHHYVGLVHELPALRHATPAHEAPYHDHAVALHHHGYRPELLRARDKVARNAALLRRRVAAAPGDLHGRYLLGRELLLAGEHAEAAAVLEAHERDWPAERRAAVPRMAACYRALALSGLGRHPEALDVLAAARGLDPDYPGYWHVAGEVHEAMGCHAEAAEAFAQALARRDYHARHPLTTSNSVPPHHIGAAAHARMRRARARAAGAVPVKPPADAEGYAAIILGAIAELERGDLAAADTALRRAEALAPDHSQVPFLQAELALRSDDLESALALAWRSITLGPAQSDPWALAGYVLHQRGDSRLGEAFLHQALARNSANRAATRLLEQVTASPRAFAAHPEIERWFAEVYSRITSTRPGATTDGR